MLNFGGVPSTHTTVIFECCPWQKGHDGCPSPSGGKPPVPQAISKRKFIQQNTTRNPPWTEEHFLLDLNLSEWKWFKKKIQSDLMYVFGSKSLLPKHHLCNFEILDLYLDQSEIFNHWYGRSCLRMWPLGPFMAAKSNAKSGPSLIVMHIGGSSQSATQNFMSPKK